MSAIRFIGAAVFTFVIPFLIAICSLLCVAAFVPWSMVIWSWAVSFVSILWFILITVCVTALIIGSMEIGRRFVAAQSRANTRSTKDDDCEDIDLKFPPE